MWEQWGFSGNSGEIVDPFGTVGIQWDHPTHLYAFCHILPVHGQQLYHSRTNPEDSVEIDWVLWGFFWYSWGFSGNNQDIGDLV